MNQLLFYEDAVAVSAERHGRLCVDQAGYAFARNTNSVPLTTVEFPKAAREYPIVFAGEGADLVPIAILGLTDRENLFIADDGSWRATYIPAFVRRYPFVFSTGDEGKTFTVCIDEGFAGCNDEGQGERLFDDEGDHTPYLQSMLAFLRQYQIEYQRTRALSSRLDELGLLEPMQASVALRTGGRLALTGFRIVSKERLHALEPEVLAEMASRQELEPVYAHTFSLESFGTMLDRFADRDG